MSVHVLKSERLKRKIQCRLCGRYNCSELKNIFNYRTKLPHREKESSNKWELVLLVHLVSECLNIEVLEDNDLPAHICNKCYNQLIAWCKFKNDCLKQQLIFQNNADKINNLENSEISSTKQNVVDENVTNTKLGTNSLESQAKSNKVIIDNVSLKKNKNKERKLDYSDEKYKGKENNSDSCHQSQCNLSKKESYRETSSIDKTNSLNNNNLVDSSPQLIDNSCESKKNNIKKCSKRKSQNEQSKFECDKCHKVFSTKWAVRNHLETHNEVQPYCCHLCGMLFRTLSYVQRHVRLHSLNKKKYCCQYCNKEFSQSAHLIHHVRIHTGEKPYKCDECQQSFLRKGQLMVHVSSVHKKEKKYICEICGKGFLCNANFKAHMLRHSGQRNAKCNVCGKSFVTNNALFRHQRLHTGEKPFACQECGKRFADSSNKKKHMISNHSGAKANKRKGASEPKRNAHANSTHKIVLQPSKVNSAKIGNHNVANEISHSVTIIESSGDPSVILLAPVEGKAEEVAITKSFDGSDLNYKNEEMYLDLTNIPVINQDDIDEENHGQVSSQFVSHSDSASLEDSDQFHEPVQENDRLEDLLIFNSLSDNVPENTSYFLPNKELFSQSDHLDQTVQAENVTFTQVDIESNYLDIVDNQNKAASTSDTLTTVASYDTQSVLKILNNGGTILMFSEQNDFPNEI